ncbi:MAG: ComEC/Rec2 family competence protein [Patescibacteria group bacterium]
MRLHDIAFYSIAFFLFGVLLASLNLSFLIIIFTTVFLAALFLLMGYFWDSPDFFRFVALSLIIILGSFYYFWHNSRQIKSVNIIFDEKIIFSGIVIDYPERGNQQKLIIEFQPPLSGRILAKLKPYPSFDYGDLIKFEGKIEKPFSKDYADYLAKDGIFGVVDFPKTELMAENKASKTKASLFKLKEKIVLSFQKVLAPEKAAFLAGITLGERAEFSKEFKEKMSKSGTTHLVALSGYNITVIGIAISSFFGWFLSRRWAFWLSITAIIGFVLMTGAEASVVRAAIMGGIALFAKEVGRVHSTRNAVAIAAFLMILFNPKILRFDLGFQLSFLALLGIVYLSPAIQKFFRMKKEKGFLGWRENFLTTTSAQLAVAPLLIINFSQFSFTSLLANVLILEAVPLTMFLGFLIGAVSFLFMPMAMVLGWLISLFLAYELAIINIFSKLSLSIAEIGIFGAMIYYLIIVGFIIYEQRTNA